MRLITNTWFAYVPLAALCVFGFDANAEPQTLATAKSAQQTVTLTGFTRARTLLDLSSEMSGRIETVFADIGEPIPKDGKFACLDRTFIKLEIESNRAEIARTKIDIAYFTKQTSRHRQLVSQRSSAQVQLDDHERSLATAQQQLRILLIKGKELAERKRRYCIEAPAGWLVINRDIEPGEWVNKGDPAAKIGDFFSLLIPYAVSMPEYRALQQTSDLIEIDMPDLGTHAEAEIARVSPAFDEQSRKIMIALAIDGAQANRRGGLRAQLSLDIPDQNNAILLPKAALDERYEQFWVQRINGERIKVVYLGIDKRRTEKGNALVRITSPLVKPGDQFVLFDK